MYVCAYVDIHTPCKALEVVLALFVHSIFNVPCFHSLRGPCCLASFPVFFQFLLCCVLLSCISALVVLLILCFCCGLVAACRDLITN